MSCDCLIGTQDVGMMAVRSTVVERAGMDPLPLEFGVGLKAQDGEQCDVLTTAQHIFCNLNPHLHVLYIQKH